MRPGVLYNNGWSEKQRRGEVPGGGGTCISCLQDKYKAERPPQLMVHLTDGYIENSDLSSLIFKLDRFKHILNLRR